VEQAYNLVLGLAIGSLILGGTIICVQLYFAFQHHVHLAQREGWVARASLIILAFFLLLPPFIWGFFSLFQ